MMKYIARTTSINDNGEYIDIVVIANNDADAMREIDRIASAEDHEIAFTECEPQQDDEITAEPGETETETETENNEQEEETMYNYTETMKNDILDYIAENIDRADYINEREELEEKLNDECWIADSVTGNASGSYFCNAYRAREAFQTDSNAADYFEEACFCFDCDPAEVGRHFIRGDYEWIDCTIRCYLLGGMISEVLDELENAGYFDESETDTSDIIDTVRAEIA